MAVGGPPLSWYDEKKDRQSIFAWAQGVVAQIRYRPGFRLEVLGSGWELLLTVSTFVADADAEKAEQEVELPLYEPNRFFSGVIPGTERLVSVKLFRQIQLCSSSTIPHQLLANQDERGLVDWVFRHAILELEKHEAGEWFRFQGRKVYDPHAGERRGVVTEVDKEKKVVTLEPEKVCDCTHPLSKHREAEEGEERDELVLCDEPGCVCPGFQESLPHAR